MEQFIQTIKNLKFNGATINMNFTININENNKNIIPVKNNTILENNIEYKHNYNIDYSYENDEEIIDYIKNLICKDLRIIIGSTQYPSYGGSATNAYNLVKMFRKFGIRTACVFNEIENRIKELNGNIDPDNIGGIFTLPRVSHRPKVPKSFEDEINNNINNIKEYLTGEPNFILAKNFVSPSEFRHYFPHSIIVFLVSGSPYMTLASKDELSLTKFLENKHDNINKYKETNECKKELIACKDSDFITTNSVNSHLLMNEIYKDENMFITDFLDTSFASFDINESNNEKIYDLIYISSNCNRTIKNAKLASIIFDDERLRHLNKLAIGEDSDKYFSDRKDIIRLDSQTNELIMDYLSKSKLLLNTSFYDASPNTIREALSVKCMVLTSRNVGFYERFDNKFICNDVYDHNEWVDKIIDLGNLDCFEHIKEGIGINGFFGYIFNFSQSLHTDFIKVFNENQTLNYIMNGYSIIRFTDSEYKIMNNKDGKDQIYNKELADKLLNIACIDTLQMEANKNIICTLNVFGSSIFNLTNKKWINHIGRYNDYHHKGSIYGSSFVFRPDILKNLDNNIEYFNNLLNIWKNKKILFVHWTNKNQKIFKNCSLVNYLICPKENAFNAYNELYEKIIGDFEKDTIIILSLGPTATVLAYDLSILGYQALDIGNFHSVYNKFSRVLI